MADKAKESQDLGEAFVESLLEAGLVRKADLQDCVDEVTKRTESGKRSSVTDVLIQEGYLTPYQFKKILRRVTHLPLVCHFCTAKVVVPRAKYKGKAVCSNCQKEISCEEGSASFGEGLVIDLSRRLGDRLLMKILVAEKALDPAKAKKYLAKASETYPRRALDKYLVEEGKIDGDSLRPLRARREKLLQKRYPFLPQIQSDVELGRFLVRLGLVSLNRLNKCLIAQAESASAGEYANLRDLLLQDGLLTEYQIKIFLPRQFDRQSRRTTTLSRRRKKDLEAAESNDLVYTEEEVMEEMRSEEHLLTIELAEDEEDAGKAKPKTKAEMYDPTALDPGNLLRQYIEKTYGKNDEKAPKRK